MNKTELFNEKGLVKYTRIYQIEMRLRSLAEDKKALQEFKEALEEDFRWKRGLNDRWGIYLEYY